jgi:acyl dehydratase
MTAGNRVLQFADIHEGMAAKPLEAHITREMIANYCASIEEDNPIYLDDAAARRAGLPGVVCPPSMCFAYAPQRRLDIMHEHGFIAPDEVAENPRNTPFVGAEVRWHGVLVRPGDVITSVCNFSKKWEARSGNRFVSTAVTARNQHGETVVDYVYNIIWESAKARRPRVETAPAKASPPPQPQPDYPIVTTSFDTIQKGARLPSITRTITQEAINRYAELNLLEGRATSPTTRQHTDPAYARDTLFGGTTLQGVTAVGYKVTLLVSVFGVQRVYNGGALAVRALEPIRPGDTVVYTGRVLSKRVENGRRAVEIEVTGTNQFGQTTAAATVGLAI